MDGRYSVFDILFDLIVILVGGAIALLLLGMAVAMRIGMITGIGS